MTTLPRIDYTARDFATIKQALILYIQSVFPDDYTDFSEASLGMILLEMNAYIGDISSFMIDRVANEVYLSTATERQNVLAIARMLGYRPRPASAASGELSIILDAAFGLDCLVAAGTQIKSGDVTYEVLEDYVLPAGLSEAGPGTANDDVPGIAIGEGVSYSEKSTGTGAPFQTYTTLVNRVIQDSVQVFVDGVLWQRVDALVFAQDTTEYALSFTADGRAVIRFGDNLTGLAPQTGQEIQVLFRSGGGVVGNAAVGVIDGLSIQGQLTDATTVVLAVSNNIPISGGAEAESNESIKFNAPRHLKTHGNAITQEDWDTLARGFSSPTVGSVAQAVVIPRIDRTNSGANEVDVYLWARGVDGVLTGTSQALKDAVQEYLQERAIWNITIFMHDGDVKPIDVFASVRVDTRLSASNDLRTTIEQRIRDFFNRSEIRPGDTFRISELYEEVQNIPGVLFSDLRTSSTIVGDPPVPLMDTATGETEVYILGDLTVEITVQGQTTRDAVLIPDLS